MKLKKLLIFIPSYSRKVSSWKTIIIATFGTHGHITIIESEYVCTQQILEISCKAREKYLLKGLTSVLMRIDQPFPSIYFQ